MPPHVPALCHARLAWSGRGRGRHEASRMRQLSLGHRRSMYKSAPSKVPIHTHGCSRSNSKFLGAQWSGMSRQCSQKPGVGAREQSLCVQVGGFSPYFSNRDPGVRIYRLEYL